MTSKIALLMFITIVLSACGADANNDDPAAQIVESYLQAKIDSDTDQIRNLICSELESTIEIESASFASVDATIENMSCSTDENIVSCDGEIMALYGTETREIPLSSYRVVQEDGEWRWCGEGN